jgi:hypothetical protein
VSHPLLLGYRRYTGIWHPKLSDELEGAHLKVRLQSIIRIDGGIKDGQGELMTLYKEPLVMDEKAHISWRSLPGLLRHYGCK